MTITLDIKPETERRLRRQAEREGQDFPEYVEALLDESAEDVEAAEEAEGTAYDLFAGRLGGIRSGGDGRWSENTGEKFTAGMVEKRKQGHL